MLSLNASRLAAIKENLKVLKEKRNKACAEFHETKKEWYSKVKQESLEAAKHAPLEWLKKMTKPVDDTVTREEMENEAAKKRAGLLLEMKMQSFDRPWPEEEKLLLEQRYREELEDNFKRFGKFYGWKSVEDYERKIDERIKEWGTIPYMDYYYTYVKKLTCKHCGEVFYAHKYRARYCSYRCANDAFIARRKMRREKAREKVCAYCKQPFKAKRKDAKYCCESHRVRACQLRNHPSKIVY